MKFWDMGRQLEQLSRESATLHAAWISMEETMEALRKDIYRELNVMRSQIMLLSDRLPQKTPAKKPARRRQKDD